MLLLISLVNINLIFAQPNCSFTVKVLLNESNPNSRPVEGVNFDVGTGTVQYEYRGGGKYKLTITGKKVGEDIELEVSKAEYEVVNFEFLNITIPSETSPNIKNIVMCKKGETQKWRLKYYQMLVESGIEKQKSVAQETEASKGISKINNGPKYASGILDDDKYVQQLIYTIASTKQSEVDEKYNKAFKYFIAQDFQNAKQVLNISNLSTEENDLNDAAEILKKKKEKLLKKYDLCATIYINEGNIDSALYYYRKILKNDSTNLSVILKMFPFLYSQEYTLEFSSLIMSANKIIPNNGDDSLRLIVVNLYGSGIFSQLSLSFLDSLQRSIHRVTNIQDSSLLIATYIDLAAGYLIESNEKEALKLIEYSRKIQISQNRTQSELVRLTILKNYYQSEKNDPNVNSLYNETIYLTKSEYSRDGSIPSTVQYGNALFAYGVYRFDKNEKDTALVNDALNLFIERIRLNPNIILVGAFISAFEIYTENILDDDSKAIEKKVSSILNRFKPSALKKAADYSFILSYLYYKLAIAYDDMPISISDDGGKDNDSIYEIKYVHSYLLCMNYAKQFVDKNPNYASWFSGFLEEFTASDNEDSSVTVIRNMLTYFEKRQENELNRCRYALISQAYLNAGFIEENEKGIFIYKTFNLFKSLYPSKVNDEDFVNTYLEFLSGSENDLNRSIDSLKINEIVEEKYEILRERVDILPYNEEYSDRFALSGVNGIIRRKIKAADYKKAENFVDSLIYLYELKTKTDSSYYRVVVSLFSKSIPYLVKNIYAYDTSSYERWVTRYKKLYPNKKHLVDLTVDLLAFEKEITILKLKSLNNISDSAKDIETKISIANKAISILQNPGPVTQSSIQPDGRIKTEPDLSEEFSIWYADLSDYLLIQKKYKEALDTAIRAILCDGENNIAKVRKANALLFSGDPQGAISIYKDLKEEYIRKKGSLSVNAEKYILNDLQRLKKYGLITEHEEEIVKLLK